MFSLSKVEPPFGGKLVGLQKVAGADMRCVSGKHEWCALWNSVPRDYHVFFSFPAVMSARFKLYAIYILTVECLVSYGLGYVNCRLAHEQEHTGAITLSKKAPWWDKDEQFAANTPKGQCNSHVPSSS